MNFEFASILTLLIFCTLLSMIILIASYVLGTQSAYSDKIAAYECGFNAFDDARMKFDVRFYLVGILFIIFDLEISFLFPWALVLNSIQPIAFWTMFVFLVILTIGFVYEWQKGALEWQ